MDSIERRYKPWLPGRWASTLPAAYFSEMRDICAGLFSFSERDHAEGYADYLIARQIHGRMEIAQTQVMPWVATSIPDLGQKRVLEIGCGTGSATAPLALISGHVHGFDINATHVNVARRRCELLGMGNVTFSVEGMDWTTRYTSESIGGSVDVVICYALMEHLMPLERIDLLLGAWRHLPIGGHFVLIEAPNRLYPFDWHSTLMPFMDQLPDEIAYLWNAFSKRDGNHADIKATTREAAAKGNRERFYRFGRGVSFHEFHTAIGVDSYRVVSSLDRLDSPGTNADYIGILKRQLAEVTPTVHPGFAYPSLDLVIEKTGPARLSMIPENRVDFG